MSKRRSFSLAGHISLPAFSETTIHFKVYLLVFMSFMHFMLLHSAIFSFRICFPNSCYFLLSHSKSSIRIHCCVNKIRGVVRLLVVWEHHKYVDHSAVNHKSLLLLPHTHNLSLYMWGVARRLLHGQFSLVLEEWTEISSMKSECVTAPSS